MALENEHKQPSFEVLCKLILALNIPADNIFYPENQHTENEKEQLLRLLSRCDERDLKIIIATVKVMMESKKMTIFFSEGGHCYLYPISCSFSVFKKSLE